MIRTATVEDAPAVANAYLALTREMALISPLTLRPLREPDVAMFRDYIQDPASAVLVAVENGTLLGFALVVTASTGVEAEAVAHRFAYVPALYVAPAARRGGVGRALVDAVTAWQTAHDLEFLQLDVLGDNLAARQFYASLGFTTANLTLRRLP
ncbi:GNAT family N-acetyltransferase [Lacticaseibacillus kribbianus]|uniref:GNAT family N-acetyltransferase n=1 Tax=Lacticaseibacillus kribbianus TaxID=2926292 RepID=UPI001CD71C93|nr:GNAT family N-acetyltransferase [Lacticaseibacillus kribbianus]